MTSEFLNDLMHFNVPGILMAFLILFVFSVCIVHYMIAYKKRRARGILAAFLKQIIVAAATGSFLQLVFGLGWGVYFGALSGPAVVDTYDYIQSRSKKLARNE